ncbi:MULTISPECIES: PAS domain S-box protein [unclassified Leptolyngbya]|uniref:PAS domain S-box protein n=1 Tax=unclassified Leptolyngbya TaxID=2650499 RepID=UPI001684F195|nr:MULTISPECIES: PAS domain S-box protein [unclassified Leptolyngbya]MBD1909723.1 PAS domain S-box protein [Leptolyngbya sp. FACHB-8]MBD2155989.1 PAS domain S-box protein [Leptolyngbya sp. FACHB-16]
MKSDPSAKAESPAMNDELAACQTMQDLERRRYLDSSEMALDGHLLTDQNGLILEADAAAAILMGSSQTELIGQPLLNFVSFRAQEAFRARLSLVRPIQCWETVIKPRETPEFPIMVALSRLEQPQNSEVALCWLLHDIRHRQRVEQQLQSACDGLEQLVVERAVALENAVDGISRLDPQGYYISVNKAYARMLCYSQNELIGMNWEATVHPGDLDAMRRAYQKMLEDGKVTVDARGLRKDGSLFYKQLDMVACYDDQQHFIGHYCFMKDVSDRRQRESLLNSIYQNAAQAIFLLDVTPDGNFRYFDFNPLAEQFGNVTNDQLRGKTPEELFGDAIGAKLRRNYERCLQQGTVVTYEECNEFEAMPRWTLTTLSPQYNEQGQIYRIIGTAVDISDRKQAEIALQKQLASEQLMSEVTQYIRQSLDVNDVFSRTVERIRQLLNTDRVVIFRFEPDGQGRVVMESVGEAWASILSMAIFDSCFYERYTEAYRQGRVSTISDVYEGVINPCYVELLETFEARASMVVPILQGEYLWGLLIAHQCSGPRHWQADEIHLFQHLAAQVGIAIQQSELYQQTRQELVTRQRVQAALQESEERFRALLDNSPTVIYMIDAQNRHILVNQRYAECVGSTAEKLQGKSIYDFWPQEIADRFAAQNQQLLEGNELLQVEEGIPLEDGILHSFYTVKFPLRDSSGKPYAICGISTDITEMKQLEAQFYRAQRLESLGTLASGIAHDLNNVFTPILAIAHLLGTQKRYLDGQFPELLQILSNSANRGAALVKQVLSFSRGTEGKRLSLQVENVLQEIVQIIQQTLPKSIRIQWKQPVQLLNAVHADPTQLHQVFINLCVNASDAMPQGGTLTLEVENCCIDSGYAQMNLDAQPGSYVVTTITDTGTGIPKHLIERIFDPFFTTKEVGKGTGLGLSTVLGIVRNHGGFIRVRSEPGQGTEFQIYLPALEGTTAPEADVEEALPQGQGEMILLVDDELAVQQVVKTVLEDCGYRTLTATDGAEAIALYREHQHDINLVLLDLMMPNMDGLTVICTLRQINPQVQIIASSGLPANKNSAVAAGAQVFLSKPYDTQELLKSIQQLDL